MSDTTSSFTNHTVAVYASHEAAEAAVRELGTAGYEIKNLSIIGQNYATEEHPVGFVNTGERMLTWGKLGAFWGGLWGLLFGSAMLFIPGIGYLMFAGWIVSALEGAVLVGGLAALGGALASIGIPKDSVVAYETALKAGSFLVVAHGSETDVERAKEILHTTGGTQVDTFTSPA
jgi:hypothetical protein